MIDPIHGKEKNITVKNLEKIIQSTILQAEDSNKKFKHWETIGTFDSIFRHTMGINKELTGLMVGVKDIISTTDFPTKMGVESAWIGTTGSFDARCVSKLRELGASIVGKQKCSEFGVHKSTDVVNPRDAAKSAGTSSSGSAVAIAAKDVHVSIATQTAGSIARPASYCGVIGFKPSYGDIPRTGVLKTTEEFDSVGLFSQNVELLEKVYESLKVDGKNYPLQMMRRANSKKITHFSYLLGDEFDCLSIEERNHFKEQVFKIFGKLEYTEVKFHTSIDKIRESHEIIYKKELSYFLKAEMEHTSISDELKRFAKEGREIQPSVYLEAKNNIKIWKDIFNNSIRGTIVAHPATSSVFVDINQKELKDANLLVTAAGAPQITLPVLNTLDSIKTGLSLVTNQGNDLNLLNIASLIEKSNAI
jgi:Asp-tRNA(Asn)/Glu-tRNA(Gln) amidotransferase A subunit family amidase